MSEKRFGPVGIIDIGSNSVRFVAYGGAARVPSSLFNEKTMAALGRGLTTGGELDEAAMEQTLEALARFRALGKEMGLKKLHTVATAAVRDASNGPAFLKRVAALGLRPRLLSGAEEAEYSGLGVISGNPRAHGIVADLGGGSLELVGVARGAAGEGVSLPLGVLRVGADARPGATIARADPRHRRADAAQGCRARAWAVPRRRVVPRAGLARPQTARPPAADRPPASHRARAAGGAGGVRARRERRDAQGAHRAVVEPHRRAAGGGGDPRGDDRSARAGARDHLGVRAARGPALPRSRPRRRAPRIRCWRRRSEIGERLGRFGDHGAALDQWIDPLFPHESTDQQRLRLAACLLGDIGWNAHPDFRAERAVDMAVHGNWVGHRRPRPRDARAHLVQRVRRRRRVQQAIVGAAAPGRGRARDRVGQGDPPRAAAQRRDRGAAAAIEPGAAATGASC